MKVIKEMYRYFDYLYESVELIGEETLADWWHKERPTKNFCVINKSLESEQEIDANDAFMFDTLSKAEEFLKEEF